MPRIEVDDEIYDLLKEDAEAFVDSPNSVLRRKLGLEPAPGAPHHVDESEDTQEREQRDGRHRRRSRSRTRAPRGSLLPGEVYERPILEVLAQQRDGRAPTREVIEQVGSQVGDQLTPRDMEELDSGVIRWQNRVQFARLRLMHRGLIAQGSPRGIWEITDQGRAALNGSGGPE